MARYKNNTYTVVVHSTILSTPSPSLPLQDKVISFLKELSDEALKKESTSEAKSDTFSSIMKVLQWEQHVASTQALPL